MGISERQRTLPNKQTKDIYLVICEGRNKTEKNYLENFKSRNSQIVLHIEKSEATDPKGMIDTAKHYIKKYGMEMTHDKAFCLMDVDVDSDRSSHMNLLATKNRNITLIRSNACFEVWLLLHFTANPKVESSSQNTKAELKSFIKDYKESMNVFQKVSEIKDNTVLASTRAKELRRGHINNGVGLTSENAIPYTDFDLLIDAILSKKF